MIDYYDDGWAAIGPGLPQRAVPVHGQSYRWLYTKRRNILKNEMWQLLLVYRAQYYLGLPERDGVAGHWILYFRSTLCSGQLDARDPQRSIG